MGCVVDGIGMVVLADTPAVKDYKKCFMSRFIGN